MKKFLDWGKIKNSFSGFEKLAFDYVKEHFDNDSWQRTAATRDGNKDACAIVIGYQLNPFTERQWWMEAKYSDKSLILSRYRLDATIVSAILEKNVTKIIFVTNIILKPKVIHDLRSALALSTGYDDIVFITKYDLEYWLINNPNIFVKYFPPDCLQFSLPELFLTNKAEFYTYSSDILTFQESLKILKRETLYKAHFSVYSSSKMTVRIMQNPSLRGVRILSSRQLDLCAGENPITVTFKLTKVFPGKNKKSYGGESLFKINDCWVIPERLVLISEYSEQHLELESQNKIINEAKRQFDRFNLYGCFQLYMLLGDSGTGKSYIISKLMQLKECHRNSVYYYEFNTSCQENISALIDVSLYILFPYLSAKDIDFSYLNQLNSKMYVSQFICKLVENRNDFEILLKILNSEYTMDDIFPIQLQINSRVIILDNVHKLNPICKRFLFNIVYSLYLKRSPILLILSEQQTEQTSFFDMAKSKIPCSYSVCKMTNEEIVYSLKGLNLLNFPLYDVDLNLLFPSILLFLEFTIYLRTIQSEINNLEEFYIAYHSFFNTNLADICIIDQFEKTLAVDKRIKMICNLIYWKESGYDVTESTIDDIKCINILLSKNLAKYNTNGKIVPYHDIYQFIYQQHYKNSDDWFLDDDFEILHTFLNKSTSSQKFDGCYHKLKDLIEQHKFYTVNYMLESLFDDKKYSLTKNRLGNERYYELFILYAISNTNINKKVSGRYLFEKIVKETNTSTNVRLMRVNEEALWELINSLYDSIEFEKCSERINELLAVLKRLSACNIIPKQFESYIRYHDIMVIKTLMEVDSNNTDHFLHFEDQRSIMKKMGFEYRAQTYTVRYAQSIIRTMPQKAIQLLKTARNEIKNTKGTDDKYYLWANFDYYYMRIIYEKNWTYLFRLLQTHETMKTNFFNDYRKRIPGIAAIFFQIGNIKDGEQYMLSDAYVERKMRSRQKAYYYETTALAEAIRGNFSQAYAMLEKSKDIFSEFPSYTDLLVHNQKVLKNNCFKKENIQFCFGNLLQNENYYIDPRCIW